MLLEELLGQIGGQQGKIARVAQERGHPFEGFNELGEIAVIVAAAYLVFSQRETVPGREGARYGRPDGAFQVKMQFGFGKGSDARGQ